MEGERTLNLHTLIEYFEPRLNRESVDCKKYNYTAIQYTSTQVFTLTIDETEVSANIDKIIIYTDGESIGLLATTPHLTKYQYDLDDIETITITE